MTDLFLARKMTPVAEPKPIGRPSKRTPELLTKLENAFAIGADVRAACAYAGITTKTYYEWIKDDAELSDTFDELREKLPLKSLQNVALRIHGQTMTADGEPIGDIDLSKWLLERKKPDDFNPKQKVEHSGGIDVPQADTIEHSPEELAALEALKVARRKRIEDASDKIKMP
jgi:hypothetical protein